MINQCEWQPLAPGEWHFGRKLRGLVRKWLAKVWMDEDGTWQWLAVGNSSLVGGTATSLVEAVKAAERATGVE